MIKPDIPPLESERLKELLKYQILDTLEEHEYNDITFIASEICNTPISLISLIDKNRQWFKAKKGLEVSETKRDLAFCAHAVNNPDDIMIIQDSRKDIRFADNPLVTGDPNVVFYAGVPLKTSKGIAVGTLCVIDHKPNELGERQINMLKALANQVVCLLELRKSKTTLTYCNYELARKNTDLEEFAFIAAHDIKSPLNNISSTINFLMADETLGLTDLAKTAIKPIDNSVRQLRKLVDGILEYSRSDKLLLQQKEHFDFQRLIESIIDLLDSRHQHTFIYRKEQCALYANKIALEQILINLISNALKYNDKPEIVVDIEMVEEANFYHFSVEDNGAGIKKEDQLKVFEIFEVLSSDCKVKLDNSGIGLATVKRLVDGQCLNYRA